MKTISFLPKLFRKKYSNLKIVIMIASLPPLLINFTVDRIWKNCLKYASKLAAFVVSKVDAVPEYSPSNI